WSITAATASTTTTTSIPACSATCSSSSSPTPVTGRSSCTSRTSPWSSGASERAHRRPHSPRERILTRSARPPLRAASVRDVPPPRLDGGAVPLGGQAPLLRAARRPRFLAPPGRRQRLQHDLPQLLQAVGAVAFLIAIPLRGEDQFAARGDASGLLGA